VGNRPGKGRGSGEEEMGGQWLSGKGEGGRGWLWKMRKGEGESGRGRGGRGWQEGINIIHMYSLVRVEKYAVCHYVQLHMLVHVQK